MIPPPDRRAKLVELAEAMEELQHKVYFCKIHRIDVPEQELSAAAERLDKAMAEAVREVLKPMNDEEKTQRALKAIVGVPMF
jgi:histidinol dehydrogenase